MKKLIAILAVVTAIGFFTPSESNARTPYPDERRIVSYHPCGAPIYAVYAVTKRDCHGVVIRRNWLTERVSHSSCYVCNPRPSCPPSHHHGYRPPVRGGGFSFSFGR